MRISDWSSDVCSSDLPEIGRKRDPAFKLDAPGLGIGGHRIRLGVDRRHRLLVRPVGAAVAPLGLAFLYASGVRQHVIKQVAGGGGAPYRAAIALGHKLGQQPAVIDMGVAEAEDRKSTRLNSSH